jgi:hypothetical protein
VSWDSDSRDERSVLGAGHGGAVARVAGEASSVPDLPPKIRDREFAYDGWMVRSRRSAAFARLRSSATATKYRK